MLIFHSAACRVGFHDITCEVCAYICRYKYCYKYFFLLCLVDIQGLWEHARFSIKLSIDLNGPVKKKVNENDTRDAWKARLMN